MNPTDNTFTAGFLACGSGLAALGSAQASAMLGLHSARCEVIGGVDIDPDCIADFERFTGARGTVADLHTMTPTAMRAAFGGRRPDVMVCTYPCKGFSRLISRAKAKEPKYQELNRLVISGTKLVLAAWPDEPPPLLLFENVEGMASVGADLLAELRPMLYAAGYVIHEGTHDAGELGHLAQHRNRFLAVARHARQVPQLLYQPPKYPVRACGDELAKLLLPNDPAAGPLHVLPAVSFRTWVRLAHIPAGKDWRALPKRGPVALEKQEPYRGSMKVIAYDEPADTIRGRADVRTGPAAVADPALQQLLALERANPAFNDTLSVRAWDEAAKAVTTGTAYTGDPRIEEMIALGADNAGRHENKFRVLGYDEPARTVTGTERIGSGAPSVADPKVADLIALTHERDGRFSDQYRVQRYDRPAATVTGTTDVQAGAPIIADPKVAELLALGRTAEGAGSFAGRPGLLGVNDWNKPAPTVTAAGAVTSSNMPAAVADPIAERLAVEGTYRNTTLGVTPWSMPARTVTGSAQIDNGAFSVGAPLPSPPFPPGYMLLTLAQAEALLLAGYQLPRGVVPVIIAPDGTWHRPLTLLELAVLQGLPAAWQGAPLFLAGGSRARIAEHIGNGLPVGTMKAIMGQMLRTLLAARVGQMFLDGALDVWVDPWSREKEHRLGAVDAGATAGEGDRP